MISYIPLGANHTYHLELVTGLQKIILYVFCHWQPLCNFDKTFLFNKSFPLCAFSSTISPFAAEELKSFRRTSFHILSVPLLGKNHSYTLEHIFLISLPFSLRKQLLCYVIFMVTAVFSVQVFVENKASETCADLASF